MEPNQFNMDGDMDGMIYKRALIMAANIVVATTHVCTPPVAVICAYARVVFRDI